jgi:hypothetical protein
VTIWGRKAGPDDSPKDMDWDTVTLEMDATPRDDVPIAFQAMVTDAISDATT